MNQFANLHDRHCETCPVDHLAQLTPGVGRCQPLLQVTGLGRSFDGTPAVADVSFDTAPGEVTCLLGPSGCGKSTTLRMIAGIERPDTGTISINGQAMSDARGLVPPERRPVGLVFQDFALFPHLDVAANVGFGLTGSARQKRERVGELLERVGLAGYGSKYPHELSGGEQQRITLIRALAPRPCLMLMDEPFSSLDHRLRDEVRDNTLALLRETGTTVLMVTHDPEEAMLMAHRIALMRKGRVVQIGRPQDLYDQPLDRDVAAFFSDLNIAVGRVSGGRVQTALGDYPAGNLVAGSRAEVVIRPQHLVRAADGVAARVLRVRYLGRDSLVEFQLEANGAVVKSRQAGMYGAEPGAQVHLAAQPGTAMIFPMDAAMPTTGQAASFVTHSMSHGLAQSAA